MDILDDKLSEIFEAGPVKTIGDLVDARQAPYILPKTVRKHKISLDEPGAFPKAVYDALHKAGVSEDVIADMVCKVVDFKADLVGRALTAPDP